MDNEDEFILFMLSEYELMNIVSSKRYSRTLPDDSIPDCSYVVIGLTDNVGLYSYC